MIYSGIDLLFIAHNYELPLASSQLVSIEAFQNIDTSVTVAAYLAEFYALRIAAGLVLACLVCALSEIPRKASPLWRQQ